MKLEDIKQIKEANSDKECNDFLDKGYKLLAIKMNRIKSEAVEQQRPVYILGKAV